MTKLKLKYLYQGIMPTKFEIREMIGNRALRRTRTPIAIDSKDPYGGDPVLFPADHDTATLVLSELPTGNHMPVIDIDLPCMLVPSSQPGNFHLYINCAMSWDQYLGILEAMTEAGVVQRGYFEHSRRRGYTSVRYPGVTKANEAERIAEGELCRPRRTSARCATSSPTGARQMP